MMKSLVGSVVKSCCISRAALDIAQSNNLLFYSQVEKPKIYRYKMNHNEWNRKDTKIIKDPTEDMLPNRLLSVLSVDSGLKPMILWGCSGYRDHLT
jgi:hypothetical protein